MLKVAGAVRPFDGPARVSPERPFRRRESRAIMVGWSTAASAWLAFCLLPGSDADRAIAATSKSESSMDSRVMPLASVVQEFHRALDQDPSSTGDRVLQGLDGWMGTKEQLELLAADGSRRITIADDLPEAEWVQRARDYRHGAEALAVASRQVPRQLERAADACVAAGDLLRSNGREPEAVLRFVRAVEIYDGILSQLGSGAGEFASRIQRKRSRTSTEAASLQAVESSTFSGQK